MKVLILGGTHFVGRHIVDAMLAAGHVVSVLNRGRSPDRLPKCVERLVGDRDGGTAGLESLRGHAWDVCIDVSGYAPRQVRPSAELLDSNVNRYVFISAVSVYGDPRDSPVTEACQLIPPASEDVTEINGDNYGAFKVACENIVQTIYGTRCSLLRPQVVAGPYDPFDRFSYWVRRAAQAGEMLAPGDGHDYLQFIDGRDLARFVVTVIENDVGGSFNLAGPRLTWAQFMKVLEAPNNVVWVPARILKTAGLTELKIPLYRPEGGARSGLMNVGNERALGAGLLLTPPEVTVMDTRKWLQFSDLAPALSPDLESDLIRMAHCG
jgi:2'-hydroxyisoflavone reductase